MNIEYIRDNYVFEKLNEKHNLDSFECGIEDLNNFLKKDALKQQKLNLNLTFLVLCDDVIIGYVSILTDTMKLKIVEDEKTKNKIENELNISENNELPAIKIGRFAIDKRYTKQGLGTHIFFNVLLSLLKLSKSKFGLNLLLLKHMP